MDPGEVTWLTLLKYPHPANSLAKYTPYPHQSEGALDPVLRYAMSQLQGAMVTGCYGNGYNCWPEDNICGLSSLIFRLWADIASNQDLTSNLREEPIDTMPTHAEG